MGVFHYHEIYLNPRNIHIPRYHRLFTSLFSCHDLPCVYFQYREKKGKTKNRLFFGCGGAEFFAKTRGKEKTLGHRRGPRDGNKTVALKRVVHGMLGVREESEWIRNRQIQCTDS